MNFFCYSCLDDNKTPITIQNKARKIPLAKTIFVIIVPCAGTKYTMTTDAIIILDKSAKYFDTSSI